jgi:glutaredoxin
MEVKLYTYRFCPYCQMVRQAFEEMDIEYEEIYSEPGKPTHEELIALGGKAQVPFLVHGDVKMYESDDIIDYARRHLTSY